MKGKRSIHVYVEGANPESDSDKSEARRAFKKFTENAGIQGVHFTMLGGRNQAFDGFCAALNAQADHCVDLLLVDSEEVIAEGVVGWEHIGSRPDNCLPKPERATEEHLFLMVCTMETWLIADQENLVKFFGHGFSDAPIKRWPDLERVPKATVIDALKDATRHCSKRFDKGSVSFQILASTSSSVVGSKCPAAKRFLDRLRKHTQSLRA